MTIFPQPGQSCRAATKTIWPENLKIFTLWSFKEKVCYPLVQKMFSQDLQILTSHMPLTLGTGNSFSTLSTSNIKPQKQHIALNLLMCCQVGFYISVSSLEKYCISNSIIIDLSAHGCKLTTSVNPILNYTVDNTHINY